MASLLRVEMLLGGHGPVRVTLIGDDLIGSGAAIIISKRCVNLAATYDLWVLQSEVTHA